MEDRALMHALGEIITTVDKMRGTHTNTQRLNVFKDPDKENISVRFGRLQKLGLSGWKGRIIENMSFCGGI